MATYTEAENVKFMELYFSHECFFLKNICCLQKTKMLVKVLAKIL
jgi:hypothetical protein